MCFLVNLPPLTNPFFSIFPLFLQCFEKKKKTLSAGFVSLSVIHMEKGIALLIVYTEDFTTQSVS